jgi:hypothetical protein
VGATVLSWNFIWPVIGFLFGITLWMPFIIGARIDAKLARLEGRIQADLIKAMEQTRPSGPLRVSTGTTR